MPCSSNVSSAVVGELQAFNHGADGAALRRTKAVVLEIQVMDDGGDPRERKSSEAEDGAQRFEGASVTLMAELHPEHVKRHAVIGDGFPISREPESSLAIDELTNEPRRRHAINARARARDPLASLKRRPPSVAVLCSRKPLLSGAAVIFPRVGEAGRGPDFCQHCQRNRSSRPRRDAPEKCRGGDGAPVLVCPWVAARSPHASTPVRRLGPVPRMNPAVLA